MVRYGSLAPDGGHLLRREDLGAEPARLGQRAPRQVAAGQAGREAEVVLDPARRAGLAAGRLALDQQRLEPLARPVDRRRQPGRPGSHDDEVVERQRRVRREADRLGQLAGRRVAQHPAVGKQDDRLGRIGRAVERLGQATALVVLRVEPGVRAPGCGSGSRGSRGRAAPIGRSAGAGPRTAGGTRPSNRPAGRR